MLWLTADHASDDLLGCDCNGMKVNQSDTSATASPDKEDNSDSDEDSDKQGFVSASQYDPNPVSLTYPLPDRR
jgi:hypothetical protein